MDSDVVSPGEQTLQEFQTSVLSCGDTSSSDVLCTGVFTLDQVSIHRGGGHYCGGSLINNMWVVMPVNTLWFIGRQSQKGPNPNEVSRTITQFINHPDYNEATVDNDMSLLKLSSSVTFTDYIKPVCLAASGSAFHSGTDTWITGWGSIKSGGETW
uniref:Peptidase S1 domain-containing protein n=1 Tax=Knipowitschia caucasica TaxID=637954 RepID=A0AAV2KGG8_KNICA